MGKDLIIELAMSTNLPFEYAYKQLLLLIEAQGFCVDSLSQEQVREITVRFLHETILATFEPQEQLL